MDNESKKNAKLIAGILFFVIVSALVIYILKNLLYLVVVGAVAGLAYVVYKKLKKKDEQDR